MRGYWRDPERSAEAIDADGWLHTGDLGFVGADGNLRIVGRLKEMYIRGGYNVYPAEVEAESVDGQTEVVETEAADTDTAEAQAQGDAAEVESTDADTEAADTEAPAAESDEESDESKA